MCRFALVLVAASCGSRQSVPAVSYEQREGANCDAGNWVPGAQEPPQYVTCAADSDCVKMSMPGCCSQTYVAIRVDRVCGADDGSSCELECGGKIDLRPDDGEFLRAACVANKCVLVE